MGRGVHKPRKIEHKAKLLLASKQMVGKGLVVLGCFLIFSSDWGREGGISLVFLSFWLSPACV